MTKLGLGFLIWISSIILVMLISHLWMPERWQFIGQGFATDASWAIWPLANFDGEHYLYISQNGYRQYEYAFFPAYPMLLKMLSWISSELLILSVLINIGLSALFLWLFYKLIIIHEKKDVANRAVLLMFAYPVSFYLVSVYSEPLFMVLTVGSFMAFATKRWWLVGVLGALACFTRLVGIFLWPAFMIGLRSQSYKWSKLIWIMLIPLGLVLVMVFNWQQTGDWLNFVNSQPSFGAQRTVSTVILPPQVLFRYLKILTTTPVGVSYYVALQELVLTFLAFGLLIYSFRKIKWEYWIYSAGVVILPTLTGTLSSMPRYILVAWPLFIVAAKLIKNRLILFLLLLIMSLLQIINIALFSNGYFVS